MNGTVRVLFKTRLIFPRINGPSDMPLKETKLYPEDLKKKILAPITPPRNLLASRSKKTQRTSSKKRKKAFTHFIAKILFHMKSFYN